MPTDPPAPVSTRRRLRPGVIAALTGCTIAAAASIGLAIPAAQAATNPDLACGRPASASSNSGTAGNADDCAAGTVWQSGTASRSSGRSIWAPPRASTT